MTAVYLLYQYKYNIMARQTLPAEGDQHRLIFTHATVPNSV